MTTIKTKKKTTNFVILDKSCLRESEMSWAAKGLHAYLMSLPENWRINTFDLAKRSRNGRDAIRILLAELEKFHYLTREKIRVNGKFERIEYIVYETPHSPVPENPTPEKQAREMPMPEELMFEELMPEKLMPEKLMSEKPMTEKSMIENLMPEKPTSEKPAPEKPAPGNPAPVNPAPESPGPGSPGLENPTLLNNKYNKYKINKIITAAIAPQPDDTATPPIAAAVDNKNFEKGKGLPQNAEPLISNTLTTLQQHQVRRALKYLGHNEATTAFSTLYDEICHGLLDPKTFSKTGNNFPYKLQVIVNSIKNGSWSPPASFVESKQKQKDSEIRAIIWEINEAASSVEHGKRMVSLANGNEIISAPYVKDIPKFTQQIIALKEKLKTTYGVVLRERS